MKNLIAAVLLLTIFSSHALADRIAYVTDFGNDSVIRINLESGA